MLAGHVQHLGELLLEAGDEVCAVLLAALLAPVVTGGQGGLHRHHHATTLSLSIALVLIFYVYIINLHTAVTSPAAPPSGGRRLGPYERFVSP